MSVAVSVLPPKARSAWTAAQLGDFIKSAGFELTLDDFDPEEQTGFLPGVYRGAPAGFEFFQNTTEEYLSMLEDEDSEDFGAEELSRIAAFGHVVELVTHSRFRDGAAACIVAGCLAAMTGGVVMDNSSGKWVLSEQALEWSREQEIQYLPLLSQDDA